MDDSADNLLLRLYNLAHRQDENFHTEVLVHLLRHLVKYEQAAAEQILRKITCENLNLTLSNEVSISINTRVRTPKGYYPDIEIRTDDHLIYIEVKVGLTPSDLQLDNYREALVKSGFQKTGLILLTKFPIVDQIKDKIDGTIRWYEIADWLEKEMEENAIHQPLSIYLVEQFLEFLKQRGLTVDKVTRELIPGIQSLLNLIVILEKALNLIGAKSIQFEIQLEWLGYFFKFGAGKYWIGLRYDQPQILLVEEKTDKTFYEQIDADKYYWGDDEYWYLKLKRNLSHDLSSDGMKFFELLKSSQLRYIEQFLNESLKPANQLQLGKQNEN